MRRAFRIAATLLLGSALLSGELQAQARTHVVLVVGLGGSAELKAEFHGQAMQIYDALRHHGVPAEDIVYLGETVETAPDVIVDRSTRANLLRELGELAQRVGESDRVLIVLIGHGTDGPDGSQFNLPGPDLTPSDFVTGTAVFPTQTLALVMTGSASGGFVGPLSGPRRVIITATRSAREQNQTEFGEYFARAMAGEGADLDHDGRVSLLEAFTFAKQEVARHYEEENEMLSEHAVLDDNGDGEGSLEASLEGPDGVLAATFTFGGGAATESPVTDDPILARLYAEREDIQRRIDELRIMQNALSEEEFLAQMEPLLVELALKNREIQEQGGA